MSYDYDLGGYSRPVTTASPDAQAWFDRGLAWMYGYHHEEAITCFRRAIEADPECAMAWWGIGYSAGPNYNKPWEAFDADDARRSLATAHDAAARAGAIAEAGKATKAEAVLIGALRHPLPQR